MDDTHDFVEKVHDTQKKPRLIKDIKVKEPQATSCPISSTVPISNYSQRGFSFSSQHCLGESLLVCYVYTASRKFRLHHPPVEQAS